LEQPVGRLTQFRLYPVRSFWSLGSGWAAVSGGLAASGLALSPETLLELLVVWFLADPLLGVVWDLGVGYGAPSQQTGIWRRLLSPGLPESAPPVWSLPYTRVGSPGYKLAHRLGQLRRWWGTTFRDQQRDFAALAVALGLALLVGTILGPPVLALVLSSVTLSWLASLADKGNTAQDRTGQASDRANIRTLWHSLGEFGIPWLIGVTVLGKVTWPVVLLGMCYTVSYFALTQPAFHFGLMGASQVTAALLLFALRSPQVAGAVAILLMPQWAVYVWANFLGHQPAPSPSGSGSADGSTLPSTYARYLQPFVIFSMLMAALAIT
jgi:hypothetical protein